ncbi:tail tape measure protein [Sphingomonas abietis]|uniref:Tail tape measure protein n=1 Tax=Sphingomonas abietis TaxID=3012344 RepID=A0ABY7NRG6_9SPHN|nr:tail tape measure protein [Sphingomonas abietis]WBO22086.1 tail tape measure protein [Sphingomonas abietis]
MDETIETLMIGVRADTQAFAQDTAAMQASLQTALGTGADQAATLIENGLARAVRSGKLGFADLEKTALAVLSGIAAQAVKGGLAALFGGGGGSGGSGGGLLSLGSGLLSSLLGAPGRATGGPVSPGRPYLVGERGPEWFVPAAAGSIAAGAAAAPSRDVRVAISINAPAGTEPRSLAQSSRQVARAVRSTPTRWAPPSPARMRRRGSPSSARRPARSTRR